MLVHVPPAVCLGGRRPTRTSATGRSVRAGYRKHFLRFNWRRTALPEQARTGFKYGSALGCLFEGSEHVGGPLSFLLGALHTEPVPSHFSIKMRQPKLSASSSDMGIGNTTWAARPKNNYTGSLKPASRPSSAYQNAVKGKYDEMQGEQKTRPNPLWKVCYEGERSWMKEE